MIGALILSPELQCFSTDFVELDCFSVLFADFAGMTQADGQSQGHSALY